MEDRHLSAILFSDISGYSSLMGDNEEKAISLLEKSRGIHRLMIKTFHGRIIDEIGDGTFACFNSALDAARCAIELVKTCCENSSIKLHIGVHLAEVIFSGNKAYGDGVNLASRIQASAGPGEILISEDIYRNIRNHEGIKAESLGEQSFKNIRQGIGIYRLIADENYISVTQPAEIVAKANGYNDQGKKIRSVKMIRNIVLLVFIVLAGWIFYSRSRRHPPEKLEKSIAVLPFKNFSGDSHYDYFSDGMTEEVINYLSKISDLKVISRTSVEQYKNSDKDTPVIARELGVSNILEGSVRKDSNRVRITVQLIQARTRFHLWSEDYDRNLSGVIRVQSDIAREVADVLSVVLTDREKKILETPASVELTAYDFYMQALNERKNYKMWGSRPDLNRTVELYRKALQIDSNFAPAYAGLGWAYSMKQNLKQFFSEDYLDSTRIYAEKALTRDLNCEEAYNVLAYYYLQHGESQKALDALDKALTINPNFDEAIWQKADILCYTNRNFVDGIGLCLKAIQLNHGPRFSSMLSYIGSVYLEIGILDKAEQFYRQSARLTGDSTSIYYLKSIMERADGNYDKAMEYIGMACKRDSTASMCTDQVAWCLTMTGHYKEALDVWQASSIPDINLNSRHRIGYLYYKLGNEKEAMKYFDQQIRYCEASLKLGREYSRSFRAQYDLAGIYAFLGKRELAYKNLEEVADKIIPPYWMMNLILIDPLFNTIRQEDRFQEIIKTMTEKFNDERDRVIEVDEENARNISLI